MKTNPNHYGIHRKPVIQTVSFNITTLALVVIVLILGSCAHVTSVQDTPVWIDVRTAAEYNSGHVDNAVNIPYQEIGQRITEAADGKDRKIFVYCGSGHRAEIARNTLVGLGYTDVTNAGGYRDLVNRSNMGENND